MRGCGLDDVDYIHGRWEHSVNCTYTACGSHPRLLSTTCWWGLSSKLKQTGSKSWPLLHSVVKKAWNFCPHFYMRLHGVIMKHRDAISYQHALWKHTTNELPVPYYRRRIATAPTDSSWSQLKLMRDVRDCSCVFPCNVACYSATDTTRSSHVAINRSSFWSRVVLGTCP
jgi:hypothetical protein